MQRSAEHRVTGHGAQQDKGRANSRRDDTPRTTPSVTSAPDGPQHGIEESRPHSDCDCMACLPWTY